MKISQAFFAILLTFGFLSVESPAQQRPKLGENAALRYWAAFSEMQDSAISDSQAKELNAILDGTAPYDDTKYKELVEKNRPALEVMLRGTAIPACDWGLDYGLRDRTPVEYARKALQLGRLNVLYAFHLLIAGDQAGATHALAGGVHFSRDVANGGSLFSTLVAKHLLESHFRVVAFALHQGLPAAQRAELQQAIAQLGPNGLNWVSAIRFEMGSPNRPDAQQDAPLANVTQAYVRVMQDASTLPQLEQLLATTPQPLRDVIPIPRRVLEEKQEFDRNLQQARVALLK